MFTIFSELTRIHSRTRKHFSNRGNSYFRFTLQTIQRCFIVFQNLPYSQVCNFLRPSIFLGLILLQDISSRIICITMRKVNIAYAILDSLRCKLFQSRNFINRSILQFRIRLFVSCLQLLVFYCF